MKPILIAMIAAGLTGSIAGQQSTKKESVEAEAARIQSEFKERQEKELADRRAEWKRTQDQKSNWEKQRDLMEQMRKAHYQQSDADRIIRAIEDNACRH